MLGRPSNYTPDIADKICALVAGGSNLKRISEQDDMPSRDAIYNWLRSNQDFADNYARARKERGEVRFDRIDDVLIDMRNKLVDANMARVEIDAIKWQCAREDPKKYGDKQTTEITGKDGASLLNLDEAARTIAFLLSTKE